MKKFCALLFCNFLIHAPALAEDVGHIYMTGNQLHEICKTDERICVSYLRGVIDGLEFNYDAVVRSAGLGFEHDVFCFPDTFNYGQAKDIFVKYLNDNPVDRHLTAPYHVIGSLSQFICGDIKQ